jgi:hypothetical protein
MYVVESHLEGRHSPDPTAFCHHNYIVYFSCNRFESRISDVNCFLISKVRIFVKNGVTSLEYEAGQQMGHVRGKFFENCKFKQACSYSCFLGEHSEE